MTRTAVFPPSCPEFNSLPLSVQRKFFSPTERQLFANQDNMNRTSVARKSPRLAEQSLPTDDASTNLNKVSITNSIGQAYAAAQKEASQKSTRANRHLSTLPPAPPIPSFDFLHPRKENRLRKLTATSPTKESRSLSKEEAHWYLSLPEKVRRNQFSREENIELTQACVALFVDGAVPFSLLVAGRQERVLADPILGNSVLPGDLNSDLDVDNVCVECTNSVTEENPLYEGFCHRCLFSANGEPPEPNVSGANLRRRKVLKAMTDAEDPNRLSFSPPPKPIPRKDRLDRPSSAYSVYHSDPYAEMRREIDLEGVKVPRDFLQPSVRSSTSYSTPTCFLSYYTDPPDHLDRRQSSIYSRPDDQIEPGDSASNFPLNRTFFDDSVTTRTNSVHLNCSRSTSFTRRSNPPRMPLSHLDDPFLTSFYHSCSESPSLNNNSMKSADADQKTGLTSALNEAGSPLPAKSLEVVMESSIETTGGSPHSSSLHLPLHPTHIDDDVTRKSSFSSSLSSASAASFPPSTADSGRLPPSSLSIALQQYQDEHCGDGSPAGSGSGSLPGSSTHSIRLLPPPPENEVESEAFWNQLASQKNDIVTLRMTLTRPDLRTGEDGPAVPVSRDGRCCCQAQQQQQSSATLYNHHHHHHHHQNHAAFSPELGSSSPRQASSANVSMKRPSVSSCGSRAGRQSAGEGVAAFCTEDERERESRSGASQAGTIRRLVRKMKGSG